jgi:predicted DsbA family dithiol-disulfide isomerase
LPACGAKSPDLRIVAACRAAAISQGLQPGPRDLFAAHFVLGEHLEDPGVIDRHASRSGIELAGLHAALADGSAAEAVTEAEMIGRKHGVQGTPAWLLGRRLITGLLPALEFERLAEKALQLTQ